MWTVGGSVAMAAGPVLGGVLTEVVGWRAVFLLNLPIGALILALLTRTAPSPRRPAPLDLAGQATAVLALAGIAFAVIEGGHLGWTSAPVLGAAALAVVAGFAFHATEKRHRAPMVPLAMLRQRQVGVSLAIGFALNAGFYGIIFMLGLYYQELRGMSGIGAGLMFVPLAAVITSTNLLSPPMAERFGRRWVIVIGQAVMVLAMFAVIPLDADTPLWLVLVLLVPTGMGGAFAVPALTALLMDAVPAERAGTASGLLNSLRQTGGAMSVALFGVLLASDAAWDGLLALGDAGIPARGGAAAVRDDGAVGVAVAEGRALKVGGVPGHARLACPACADKPNKMPQRQDPSPPMTWTAPSSWPSPPSAGLLRRPGTARRARCGGPAGRRSST